VVVNRERAATASRRSRSAAGTHLGSEARCQPDDDGTAPRNPADVRPVACANRRNERTDLAIDFAEFVLRSRQYSTMNAVTVPASRRLTDTCAGRGSAARNCSACQQ
jgi:hypothetical protein